VEKICNKLALMVDRYKNKQLKKSNRQN